MDPGEMSHIFAPTELLYEIINIIWESHLSPDDRVQFMNYSRLVSKRWSAVYEDISSSDIHIPCESFYHYFFNDDTRNFAKCKRITFTVYDPEHACSIGLSSGRSLSYMRHGDIANLVALNSVNIVYHNTTFPDPYVQGFFLALPRYLPRLSISYTFSPEIPENAIIFYRRHFERQSTVRYANPVVGTLEVNGADEYIGAIWESLFPEREKMLRDGKEEKQPLIKVSSRFDFNYALLVRLLDIHRQQEKGVIWRGEASSAVQSRSNDVTHVDLDGVSFVTMNISFGSFYAPSFRKSVLPGDVGYIDKSTGMFEFVFNAFKPRQVDGITIPSLFGYGDATMKYGKRQNASLTDTTYVEEKKVQGGLAALSNSIGKALSGWRWRWSAKKIRYIEGSTVERWFVANTEKIERIYGECLGMSEDNMVIVTGIVA